MQMLHFGGSKFLSAVHPRACPFLSFHSASLYMHYIFLVPMRQCLASRPSHSTSNRDSARRFRRAFLRRCILFWCHALFLRSFLLPPSIGCRRFLVVLLVLLASSISCLAICISATGLPTKKHRG